MAALNYKHLRYFWMVAKSGSIARAAQQLHLAPNSISSQIAELEVSLAVELFRRQGRGLELTEVGRRVLSYAEEIFSAGEELLAAVRDQDSVKAQVFRVGVADSVSKVITYRLIEPALGQQHAVRLICREGRLNSLLADLAIHRLDLIIADRQLPQGLNVRGYSHLLAESGLALLASPALAKVHGTDFPALLDGAPLLIPGDDVAIRGRLVQWLREHNLHPKIVGEFDDSALMKTFGHAGAGMFFAPSAIAAEVCAQYGLVELGRLDAVVEQVYVITTEKRISHPLMLEIRNRALARFAPGKKNPPSGG